MAINQAVMGNESGMCNAWLDASAFYNSKFWKQQDSTHLCVQSSLWAGSSWRDVVIWVTSAHKIKALWYKMLLGHSTVWPSFPSHGMLHNTYQGLFIFYSYCSGVAVAAVVLLTMTMMTQMMMMMGGVCEGKRKSFQSSFSVLPSWALGVEVRLPGSRGKDFYTSCLSSPAHAQFSITTAKLKYVL